MATTICHASIDERGKISNGASGDQTGREVCTREWYNKPWNVMLRYEKDPSLGKQAAAIAKKIADSNLVGYDQNQRNTLYAELKKHNFNVDNYIASRVKTETDCSAFVFAVWCCVIPSLRYDGNAPTTSTMQSFYTRHGFTAYTDARHTASDSALFVGDILVKAGSHTVLVYSANNIDMARVPDVKPIQSATHAEEYPGKQISVTATTLNVRKGPGVEYPVTSQIHRSEVYHIIETKDGWGRLTSGAGWISLKYTKYI